MYKYGIFLASTFLAGNACAQEVKTTWTANREAVENEVVTTGVARGRDRLSSATSTSTIREGEINRIGPQAFPDLVRYIPGIRVEAGGGEAGASYTVRGLPLVSEGAKYLQLQEDGLPVLEFGDIYSATPDMFIRLDANVASVESIRGGSASTFASNAPGGVINLISKTGDVEGGSLRVSSGLGTGTERVDVEFGGRLGKDWRFHVGGFYRAGSGPFSLGYNGYAGGQVKFNVTREFTGGHIRVSAKLLDDRVPHFTAGPISVDGTDADPKYGDVPGFSVQKDQLVSRYLTSTMFRNTDNQAETINLQSGMRAKQTALGMEAQFTLGEFTVVDRMRYASSSGSDLQVLPIAVFPAVEFLNAYGGAGLVYATGPQTGQSVANPASLNGNGLVAAAAAFYTRFRDLGNFTNDLRISRVVPLGQSSLTLTGGIYRSHQVIDYVSNLPQYLETVTGGGNGALLDVVDAQGQVLTATGYLGRFPFPGVAVDYYANTTYDVTAPYGSFNYAAGDISIGGSVRYDHIRAQGSTGQNGPNDFSPFDVNGDGAISPSEVEVPVLTAASRYPVNYSTGYASYSLSVNYRPLEWFSAFGRYSRGGRASADRILGSDKMNLLAGTLAAGTRGYDPVRQAEIGIKLRKSGASLNLTGFWARVSESNFQTYTDANGVPTYALFTNGYRAMGLELEAAFRRGPVSIKGGATYTNATIVNSLDPALVGNTPRRQPRLLFQFMPTYDVDLFTIGANVVGTGSSYAQDINLLKQPAYTTVGAFAQVRPMRNLELSLNVANLFDTLAITDVIDSAIPASRVVSARSLPGRTVNLSSRFFF